MSSNNYINLISIEGIIIKVYANHPTLTEKYFSLIDLSCSTNLDEKILKIIFYDEIDLQFDDLIKRIPILSSINMILHAKKCYLKLFSLINISNINQIDILIDDMINYFSIDDIINYFSIIDSELLSEILLIKFL